MKILVTGGAGFIGSNFIRYALESLECQVVNLDALTYAGNLENLAEVAKSPLYHFVQGDITDEALVRELCAGGLDAVINFAAETHVDRSILSAHEFVRTNCLGTQVLLEAARRHKVGRFLQISTDEVYGSLPPHGVFTEETPLSPNSPYAASKGAADLLVLAYHRTYGMDALITRCSNNYGPYQFPEKFIPLMILNALKDQELPIYGDGLNVRDWIHVRDHCEAIGRILQSGRAGCVYNIGAEQEEKNLDVAVKILEIMKKPQSLLRFVADRPGHDRRYAIDASRVREEFAWAPRVSFDEGLAETVQWYSENHFWVKNVQSGAYRDYYHLMYSNRDKTLSDL